jgi:hypothetical protein
MLAGVIELVEQFAAEPSDPNRVFGGETAGGVREDGESIKIKIIKQ